MPMEDDVSAPFWTDKGGTGLLNKTAGILMIGSSGWLVAG